MAESGRRAAREEWRPGDNYDERAVFQSIMDEALNNAGYDPEARGADRLYERVNLAVTPYTDAYEQEWHGQDRALDERSEAVGRAQAMREADALVFRRRSQRNAARDASRDGHRITFAVEEAMNAAGFWLSAQGGNNFSYTRSGPGGSSEFLVSSRDNNPPESLSEAVTHVRESADGSFQETSFSSLRRALAAVAELRPSAAARPSRRRAAKANRRRTRA